MPNNLKHLNKPVVDATAPITVVVERKDIKGAQQTDDRHCPIANSLKREYAIRSVSVGACFVYLETDLEVIRYKLKDEDRRMVGGFDKSGYFRPCTLELLPPPASQRIGARAGTKPGSNTRTGRARTVRNAPPLRHVRLPNP